MCAEEIGRIRMLLLPVGNLDTHLLVRIYVVSSTVNYIMLEYAAR